MAQTLTFESHGTRCVATLYLPNGSGPGPCLVMGHGFTGTQDQLEPYARWFTGAGIAVLTFDYRNLGRSEGEPRQLVNVDGQLQDWRAAVVLARSLVAVDPQRIALWGSSLSGSHVVRVAADDPAIAAVVVQVPVFDKSTGGMAREARAKMAREGISLGALLWVTLRTVAAGIYDALRGVVGWSPYYMPIFGEPGHVAAFTDPDSSRHRAMFEKAGASWRNEFTPRFLFGTPKYVEPSDAAAGLCGRAGHGRRSAESHRHRTAGAAGRADHLPGPTLRRLHRSHQAAASPGSGRVS